MQQMTSYTSINHVVDLSEARALFDEYVKTNWDGRDAPVSEIWSFAFNDWFIDEIPTSDFFYTHRFLIGAARFLIRTHLERAINAKVTYHGKLHGHLAVVAIHSQTHL